MSREGSQTQPCGIFSRRLRAELDAVGAMPPSVAEIDGEDEWDWLYEW